MIDLTFLASTLLQSSLASKGKIGVTLLTSTLKLHDALTKQILALNDY